MDYLLKHSRTLAALLVCLLFLAHGLPVFAAGTVPAAAAWAQPAAPALKDAGSVAPVLGFYQQACMTLTYRMVGDPSKTMHQGCFVTTAFGLYDASQSVAIFTGTDEGESIYYGGQLAALSAIPGSGEVALFQGSNGGGGLYMHMYTNFLGSLSNTTDAKGDPAKALGSYNTTIPDGHGNSLGVNPTALAYSARGEWMVTESPSEALIRVSMSDYTVTPFAPVFVPDSAAHSAAMAITQDGTYAAVAGSDDKTLTVYDLSACTPASASVLQYNPYAPDTCANHNYWPYLSSVIPGLSYVSQLSFVNDGLLDFTAHHGDGTAERYVLAPAGSITSLIPYLALGDSYASGQGAFDYLAGTDTAVNSCHISAHAYPLLLSSDLFSGDGHSAACSGARINDLMSTAPSYVGQAKDAESQRNMAAITQAGYLGDFTPGYLPQDDFVTTYQPGVITVQIGGNDAGFASILERCMMPGDCFSTYEERAELEQSIDQIYTKWTALFQQLRSQSPLSRIYAVGYPQIIATTGRCGLNTPLSHNETVFAQQLTDYLNSVLQQAAQASGVQYVDISQSLAGHQLCDGNTETPGVNGVTAGTDVFHIIGAESFHPTAFGDSLIEQAIITATRRFQDTAITAGTSGSVPDISDSDALLAGMPKSGAAVVPTTYMDTLSLLPAVFVTGTSDPVDVPASMGFAPSSSYSVNLANRAAYFSNLKASTSGELGVTLFIDNDIAARGLQPIVFTGTGLNGKPLTVVQMVYIQSSADDYDGDGIPNSQDSCPTLQNSGIDADGDGVDDVCDGVIATAADSTSDDTAVSAPDSTTDNPASPDNEDTGSQTDNPAVQQTANPQPVVTDGIATMQRVPAPGKKSVPSQTVRLGQTGLAWDSIAFVTMAAASGVGLAVLWRRSLFGHI